LAAFTAELAENAESGNSFTILGALCVLGR
jgi:hypothetical protein